MARKDLRRSDREKVFAEGDCGLPMEFPAAVNRSREVNRVANQVVFETVGRARCESLGIEPFRIGQTVQVALKALGLHQLDCLQQIIGKCAVQYRTCLEV